MYNISFKLAFYLFSPSLPDFKFPVLTQSQVHHATPIYETMPAWDEDITGVTQFADLPQKAQDYVLRLEELSGCRISYIGVGPGRDQTIVRHDVLEA